MHRIALIALFGCSSSALTNQTDVADALQGFRTDTPTRDLAAGATERTYIHVPMGTTFLEVDVSAVGSVDVTLSFEDQVVSCGAFCRIDAPEKGTWTIELTSVDGARSVELGWEFGGDGDGQAVRLIDRPVGDFVCQNVGLPNVIGDLRVSGTSLERVSVVGETCESAGCLVRDARYDELVCAAGVNGQGRLQVDFEPLPTIVDRQLGSGDQGTGFTVPNGVDQLIVRADRDDFVRVMQGQFELCSGTETCTIDYPMAGEWRVEVSGGFGDRHLRVATRSEGAFCNVVDDQSVGNGTRDTAIVADWAVDRVVTSEQPSDWFVLGIVQPGEEVTAEVLFAHADGDVDARLWVGTDLVDSSSSITDDEVLSWRNDGAATLVYLEVLGYGLPSCGSFPYDVTSTIAAPSAPQAGFEGLILQEVLPAPNSWVDVNCDGAGSMADDEFVEIRNAGTELLDISGVSLHDGSVERHVFAPGTVLQPGEVLAVFGNHAMCEGTVSSSSGYLGLNNTGDTLSLLGPSGDVIDIFAWTESLSGISWLRDSATSDQWSPHDQVFGTNASPGQ